MLRYVIAALCLGIGGASARQVLKVAQAVSTRPAAAAHFARTREPLNLVILGYVGGSGQKGAQLTDAMLVLSVTADGSCVQINVPRDLWTEIPAASGQYAKLNSAYEHGLRRGGMAAGGKLAAVTVGGVLGIAVPYWLLIDLRGFKYLVDALGGVKVDVERTFTTRYVAHLNPYGDINEEIFVTFFAGRQRLDGYQAACYARARYTDHPLERNDFARGRRQQKLVDALAARLKSPAALLRVAPATQAVGAHVKTNLALLDLAHLALWIARNGTRKVVLDTSNVLAVSRSEHGRSIVLPRGGDWAALQRYVQQQLER